MARTHWLLRRVWSGVVIGRLRLAHLAFGIEAVNGDLLTRTRGTKQVLSSFGAKVASSARIHGPLVVHNADPDYSNLQVGANAHIGRGVLIDLTARVTVEDSAVVAMQATILTHTDSGNRPATAMIRKRTAHVAIGAGAYIGARAIIMPGVWVGAGAVVAAGAVVTRDVPEGSRVAGVPARTLERHQV